MGMRTHAPATRAPAAPITTRAAGWELSPAPLGTLQRKCGCGAPAGPEGECQECGEKEMNLQRRAADQAGQPPVPPIVHEVLRGSGQPLDPATRAFMEPRFGHDFGAVRVHTDARAGQSARSVNALAYTVGRDLVFGAGQYAPSTAAGQKLIAHELAHTIQQRDAFGRMGGLGTSVPGDALEEEADDAAEGVTASDRFSVTERAPAILARDTPKGPSPGLTDEEKEQLRMQEEFKKAQSVEKGRTPPGVVKTWGWGGPETDNIYQECTVAPMDRPTFRGFVKSLSGAPRRNRIKDLQDVMGITHFDPNQAVAPKIEAEPIVEGKKTLFKLKPTHAEMPPIQSAYTRVDKDPKEFVEGSRPYAKSDCNDFWHSVGKKPPGRYDVIWLLPDDGAEMFRQMELEHCADIRLAFELTLVSYASSLNNLAASERTYDSEKQVMDTAVKWVSTPPGQMIFEFYKAAAKTEARDAQGWHSAKWETRTNAQDPDPNKNLCRGFIRKLDASTGPDVGHHPSSEVITLDPAKPAGKKP